MHVLPLVPGATGNGAPTAENDRTSQLLGETKRDIAINSCYYLCVGMLFHDLWEPIVMNRSTNEFHSQRTRLAEVRVRRSA
jgi:hypothetical protein